MAALQRGRYAQYGREMAAAMIEDFVLDVPSGFLGDKSSLPLWIHPNYELLEAYIDSVMRRKATATSTGMATTRRKKRRQRVWRYQFHLVGTPGIGKSYFGHYWLYKQAQLKRKGIWRTKGDVPLYLYYDFSLDEPLVDVSSWYQIPVGWTEAEMDNIWLIIDGHSKGILHYGPALQCVSPGRSGYHEFSKEVGVLCHLEAWNLEDLKACRDELELEFDDVQLEKRFAICGGMPRLIFDDKMDEEKLKTEMDNAAARCKDWKKVVSHATGDGDKDDDISDYLLHYKLPEAHDLNQPYYNRVAQRELIFGSEYIEEMVCGLYEAQGFEAAREFFDFCQEIPAAQCIAGKVFERHVHKKLRAGGGDFKIKALNGPTCESPISLRPLHFRRLRRWEITRDIPSEERGTSSGRRKKKLVERAGFNVYDDSVRREDAGGSGIEGGLASVPAACFVEPYSAIQKAFDSLLMPDIIFQETVSANHKLFWSAIWEIAQEYDIWHRQRNLPVPPFYKLIFVVPESKFDAYKFQEYKKDDGDTYKVELREMGRVRQYAVAFPWK